MKIIKHGKAATTNKWHRRCECGHCGAILKVEEADLTRHNDLDPRQGCDDVTFDCPACPPTGRNLNRVPDDSVPMVVRRRITQHRGLPPTTPKTCKVIVMRGSV